MKTTITTFIYAVYIAFIYSCSAQNKTKEDTILYAPSSITRTIKQDAKGNIWFATWKGMIKYDGTTFTNVTRDVSLSRFFSVLEDRKGNFWFGSIGSGVYYYDGKTFRNYTTKNGLANNRVTYIYEDKLGNIWFGTEGGASCYNGKKFINFTVKDGLPNNDVNSIIQDHSGRIWFGTRGAACFYDGSKFSKITTKKNVPLTNVRSILEDKKGNIWFGGNDGLWCLKDDRLINFATKFVGYIYEDKKGNIWTSSESKNVNGWALSRYDANTLHNINSVYVTELKAEEGMFFGILEDKLGNIWVGTLNGVYLYDGKTFKTFKNEQPQ